ncbi:ABC transporter permease [Rhodococcus sp. WS3]|nr:ABC transporter permease [Rhodococcus sp. WS3]
MTVKAHTVAHLKAHRSGFIAVFVSVFCAALLTCALGVLLESGVRGGVSPHLYAGADAVVSAPQALAVKEDADQPFAERVLLDSDVVHKLDALDATVVPDISVPVSTADGVVLDAHPWRTAQLAPYSLTEGRAPQNSNEVVSTTSAAVGERITLAHGGIVDEYTVVGTADSDSEASPDRPALVFLEDQEAQRLWPHHGSVTAVGVIAPEGVNAAALASEALSGTDAEISAGTARGGIEFLDAGAARTQLIALCASFAGLALMVAMFVVSSTLSLSINARRREFALLRAIGATTRQIHTMIGREVLLVATAAATLGLIPGFLLAKVLGAQFASAGVIPPDFALVYSPIPALGAFVICVLTARGAAAVAARRPAKLEPTEALRESERGPAELSRPRIVTGAVLGVLGLSMSVLPAFLPGEAAAAGAGSSALLLIFSVALLGPLLVRAIIRAVGGPLRRSTRAPRVLAAANAESHSRRLSSAIVPLALAIALGSVQFFSQSTVAAEATDQSIKGVTADLIVGAPAGIAPALVDSVRAIPGVSGANPVVRSQVLPVTSGDEAGAAVTPISAQGIDAAHAASTLDLDVVEGDLADLTDDTVAVSSDGAFALGARVGGRIDLHLGDGTVIHPLVVAKYGRGLGFGDVTLPVDTLRTHSTDALIDTVLVRAEPGRINEVQQSLQSFSSISAMNQDQFGAAGADERRMQSWVSILAVLVLLGYLAVAVVNTLVAATAERAREFALLQLVGARTSQVRAMMRIESVMVVGIAIVVGTLIAIPPLVGIAIAVSGAPVPTVSPAVYGSIVAVTAALGFLSIAVPTRGALRKN